MQTSRLSFPQPQLKIKLKDQIDIVAMLLVNCKNFLSNSLLIPPFFMQTGSLGCWSKCGRFSPIPSDIFFSVIAKKKEKQAKFMPSNDTHIFSA